MATAIPFEQVFQTVAGAPVSGVKVYTYAPGTTTPRTAYSDTGLSVPVANPFVGDAAGYAAFYLSSDLGYRIVAKSADDSITYYDGEAPSVIGGAQPVDATLTAVAALGLENRKLIRGTGVDTGELVTLSAASGLYYVEDYGATGDGSTDDRAAIQSAITAAAAAGGGTVWLTEGNTYRVGNSGSALGGVDYAIALAPGVYLDGGGTIARSGTSMAFTLIAGFGSGTFPNITDEMGLRNITVDGKASTRVDSGAGTGSNGDGFNVWLVRVANPVCQNIVSNDSANWGIRIEQCLGGAFVGNIKCEHGPDVNADGVHFVDCRNITGDGFEIITEGDDAFIFEAKDYDCFGVVLTGISVRAPASAVTSARRGILILRDTSTGTTNRDLYNCRFEGATNGCDYAGMVIQGGAMDVYGCTFSVASYSDRNGLEIYAGDSLAAGTVVNNTFQVVCHDSDRRGVVADIGTAGGSISNNTIVAQVYNPGDGYDGIYLDGGSYWSGSLIVDYDPNGTKASQTDAISLLVTSSSLYCSARDSRYNVRLRSGCGDNTIYLGHITGGITADILTSGATDAVFYGGVVDGTATGGCQFVGTTGQSTILAEQVFTTWSPTVSSSSGTITSSTVNYAEYKNIDGFLEFEMSVTITDNGTGAGFLRISPPTTPARAGTGLARNTSSGATLYASWTASASFMSFQTTGGAYPVTTGQTVIFAGRYFVS